MKYLLYFFIAVSASLCFTPLVIVAARKTGFVAQPRSDRWHKKPTPILGGIAIVASFISIFLISFGIERETLPILIGGILVFLLGLADDLWGITPQVKFIGQIAITALLISMGVVVKIIPYPVIALPITFLWIVGLTNAFNLVDNMDGLSAGIAAISSLALFAFSLNTNSHILSLCSIVLAGSCVGFLFYNFNPARIFMGDCGSMFLGFILATISILGTWKHASSLFVTLLCPVIILGIPIFDTIFVTSMRRLKGQPISQGGRDHISHRLVELGFSEKKTVLLLYGVSAVFALGSIFLNKVNPLVFASMASVFILGLFYFSIFLGFSETKNSTGGQLPSDYSREVKAFLVNAQKFTEIFVDLALVAISYFASYLIRFEGALTGSQLNLFIQTLPIIVVVKISVFYYFGLYRMVWRHVGVRDFISILKAVFVSSLIVVAAILLYSRFQYFSRAVYVIDGMLSLILISGSHFLLKVLREYLEGQPVRGKKVLLIGAGDAGEMALREIRNNPSMKFNVVGFLDDDPFKQKRKIHGVQVLGKIDEICAVLKKTKVREAFIAIPSAPDERIERIVKLCEEQNIICRPFF